MFKRMSSQFFMVYILLAAFCVVFYACEQNEPIAPQDTKLEQTAFQEYLADHTQHINATDLGDGNYEVTGLEGTQIEIENALVDNNGNRVRGAIDIELIEVYTVPDMILLRKQTLADDDGQLGILESGGEVFLKVYQNGKELSVDGKGSLNILLPAANTGGVKEGMEVYIGEATGEQVIWKPTGNAARVIYPTNRNDDPFYLIQNILGWVNIDKLNEAGGDPVDCIDVEIACQLCEGAQVVAAIYVSGLNSAFELPMAGPNSFQLCGGWALGGVDVTFVIAIQCPDGTMYSIIKTVTINAPNHSESLNCNDMKMTDIGQFEMDLHDLVQ